MYGATPEQLKYDFGQLLNKAHTEFRHRYPGVGPVYIIEQFIPAARELLTTVNNAIRGPGLVTYD
jgi:hypothetical protein